MLQSGSYYNSEDSLENFVKLLTDSQEDTHRLVSEVVAEMERQLKIRSRRLAAHRSLKKQLAMGSQSKKDMRVHRLCESLFGDPSKWLPIGPVTPRMTQPFFRWFKRTDDNVLVAGVEGRVGSELRAGFVFNIKKGSTTRYARLPFAGVKGYHELLRHLGRSPRLHKRRIKIDWMRRAFVIDGTNHLAWVYP